MRNIHVHRGMLAAFLLTSFACKEVSKESSGLNADAAAVAAGNEALLSSGSLPEPKASPKLAADALNSNAYRLADKSFSRLEVGDFQVAGSDLTGTPKALQGIWWMDGNPLKDETISFANVDFSQDKPLLPVFGPGNFTFHAGTDSAVKSPDNNSDDKDGINLYALVAASGVVYEFDFSRDRSNYTFARIVPVVRLTVGILEKMLRVSPKIVEFTMTKVTPNLYKRENAFFGKSVDSYQFRRILVPSEADPRVLEKTEFWDDYAAQTNPKRLRMTEHK